MRKIEEFQDNEEYSLDILIKQVEHDINIALSQYLMQPFRQKPKWICDIKCRDLAMFITTNQELYEKFRNYMDAHGYRVEWHSLMGYRIFSKD